MADGSIKRLTEKGFGFISTSEGTDVFFHSTALIGVVFEELRVGQRVEFTVAAQPGRFLGVGQRLQLEVAAEGADVPGHPGAVEPARDE